jgi:hypothetical protein
VAAQMIFLVAVPLVWSVLIVFFPHVQVWAALFGISVACSTPCSSSSTRKA